MTVWPTDKTEMLQHLIETEGLTYQQAGSLMGITKNAAVGKGARMGLRSHHPNNRAAPVSTLPERMDALEALGCPPGCCHYPIGEVGKPGFRFCGKPADEHSYCAEHRALTMRPAMVMAAE